MFNKQKNDQEIASLQAQLTALRQTAEGNLKRATEAEKKLAEAEKRASEAEKRVMEAGKGAAEAGKGSVDLQKRVTELEAQLKKTENDLAMRQRMLTTMEGRLNSAEARVRQMVTADDAERKAAAEEQAREAAASEAGTKEHKLTADETLSHLALKYYGSAYEPYWRVIYEANKELIGDNPARVRPGMMIKIPPLPEELKKK